MHPIDGEIDEGIATYVSVLRQKGFNTFMSCQGAMPDKTSKHACWAATIGICPFPEKEDYHVYIDEPNNPAVYKEYID